jgi:hypothetical protein
MPSSEPPPQIRHSGRAHVRGKIRRVWRPRFLELLDNGLVRYYELPTSSHNACEPNETTTAAAFVMILPHQQAAAVPIQQQQQQQPMIHKYALRIFEARILDVTTLRDMHVGLPRGSYGLVFRGQRLLHLEQQQQHNNHIHPTSAGGPYFVVQHCRLAGDGAAPVKEQRDFLCAVPSLEEAQMWVVALQWAATLQDTHVPPPPPPGGSVPLDHGRRQKAANSGRSNNHGLSTSGSWEHEDDDMMGVQVLDSAHLDGEWRNSSPSHSPNTTTSATVAHDHASAVVRPATRPPAAVGKVVVCKVAHYRTVRTSTWTFDIAYEIQGTFLGESGTNKKAEQWSMLRTADDVERLHSELVAELGPLLIEKHRVVVGTEWPRKNELARLGDRPTAQFVARSIVVLDNLLRALVMDATVVNTAALKTFLGVSGQIRMTALSYRFWNIHDGQSIVSQKTVVLHASIGTDQFVKQWLQDCSATPQSTLDVHLAFLLQRPLWLLGGLALSPLALMPLTRLWQQWMPTLSMRLDFLVVYGIGASYLGSLCPWDTTALRSKSNRHASSSVKRPLPTRTEAENTGILRNDSSDDHTGDEDDESSSDGEDTDLANSAALSDSHFLSSPLPKFPANDGRSCWSQPDANIFYVRGVNYLKDRVKVPSGAAPLSCRGVDVWMTDSPERNISRHPSVLGGRLGEEDTFLVNFLLPFGNLVAYFSVPPLPHFPKKLQSVWTKFLRGDQTYRDARLKLLPVVTQGPWIVKAAVGPGKSPALLGKVIPLQYFFRDPDKTRKGVYEVDVIITASSIAKGILSVVKGHTKSVSLAFAFIIEAAEHDELPETVLCCFQLHPLHLENCPELPLCILDEFD